MEDNKQQDQTEVTTTEQKVSALAATLSRNTSQIKADRASEISELLEIEAKRKVEDIDREVKQLERRRKSSLDLSPDNTYSIMKVKDFEPKDFMDVYTNLGLQIREAKVRLNIAKQAYNELFGETYHLETII